MQYELLSGDRSAAGLQVTDIAGDQSEARVVQERRDILVLTGGKVVETGYLAALFQQRLDQIGADETGSAGDQNPG